MSAQEIVGWPDITAAVGGQLLARLLWTAAIVLVWVIVRLTTSWVMKRRLADPARRYVARKAVSYGAGLAGVLGVIHVWLGGLGAVATYLGLFSAGLMFALRDPLTSLAGGLYILTRRPFSLGDRIQVGQHAGDVVDIGLFRFSVVEIGNWVDADQSTGRIIHLPNAWVFTQAVANYSQGFNFIWNEVAVTVSFASNWRRAKDLLMEIGRKHCTIDPARAAEQVRQAGRSFLIYFEYLTPIVWTSTSDKGVVLSLRYVVEPKARRTSEARIWEDILQVFAQHPDIGLAVAGGGPPASVAEGEAGPRQTPG